MQWGRRGGANELLLLCDGTLGETEEQTVRLLFLSRLAPWAVLSRVLPVGRCAVSRVLLKEGREVAALARMMTVRCFDLVGSRRSAHGSVATQSAQRGLYGFLPQPQRLLHSLIGAKAVTALLLILNGTCFAVCSSVGLMRRGPSTFPISFRWSPVPRIKPALRYLVFALVIATRRPLPANNSSVS